MSEPATPRVSSVDPVLNPHEVAAELEMDYLTVCSWLRRGLIKGAKHGNRWFIRRSWLDEFLKPTNTDVA